MKYSDIGLFVSALKERPIILWKHLTPGACLQVAVAEVGLGGIMQEFPYRAET